MSDAFTDEHATRIVAAIETRLNRKLKSGSYVQNTWGTVASVAGDGKTAGAYLYGETDGAYISDGFRVPETTYLTVGQKVRVAIDYGTGDRWIEEVNVPSAYKKVAVNLDGTILFGDGTSAAAYGLSYMSSGTIQSSGTFHINSQDGTNEGGELILGGAGVHPEWHVDVYANDLRFFRLSPGGPGVEVHVSANSYITGLVGLEFQADTNLYRSGPNALKTDDSFRALSLTSEGDTYSGAAVYVGTGVAYDTYLNRVSPGVVGIYTTGTADQGLNIGDDATLYDVDLANMLGIKSQSDATFGGFVFGSGKDTNLYRSAANTLTTDDSLVVRGNIYLGNDDGGNSQDGIAIVGGNIEMRNANPFIDFKTSSMDYGARIIYDLNISDGLEFYGAAGGYWFDYTIRTNLAGSADSGLAARTQGDFQDRFLLLATGELQWGPGSSAIDVQLYRSAANVLSLAGGDRFDAPNIFSNTMTLTPVANTPTSITETFPGSKTMTGTLAVGTTTNTTLVGSDWKGESCTSVSSTSITMYGYRTNTTNTSMHYVIVGI